MKIPHKPRALATDRTDPAWAERVEREAEQHTARTEAAWHKAQRRLERALVKARDADQRPDASPRKKATLWQIVEKRRDELKAIERLARATPAGSQNRGRGSYRGVSTGEAL